MRGFGTFNQPAGTWSDDFALTACLVESLIYSGPNAIDLPDLAQRFISWLRHNYWSAGVVFDVGFGTRKAIERLENGVPPTQSGGDQECENGNGALMRVLPLAFHPLWRTGTTLERQNITELVAGVTHRHPRSSVACFFYLQIAENILAGDSPLDAYRKVCQIFAPQLNIRLRKELPHFTRLLSGEIHTLPQTQIYSDGYVVHSIEAVLWCLLNHQSYVEVVLTCVNLGSDTDTNAAIAGGLAALAYGGEKQLPLAWLDMLARRDDIKGLASRFTVAMNVPNLFVHE